MSTLQEEMEQTAAQFGVSLPQVERDHLISHTLAAVSRDIGTDDVIFFGGTALSRTHLRHVRLSEDIDLVAASDRAGVAFRIENAVRRLRRTHGNVTWNPALSRTREAEPSLMRLDSGISVRVQLLSQTGYPPWPTEVVDIDQRYADAPPARLRVYTSPAFAAAKLSAWLDRNASRDLYDLYAMSRFGLITTEAAALFTTLGSLPSVPGEWAWNNWPSTQRWQRELGHQMRLDVGPEEAARAVRNAWLEAAG